MAKDNRKFFGTLSGVDPDEIATERKRRGGYLEQRENTLARITSGEVVDKTLIWEDPSRCRMWERHNRRYELLNEKRCGDLIEGLKAQGRQEFPAIVRRLKDDSKYEYEVICGARRHWAVTWLREHNYSEFKFLVEVRDLTDEQAFRLSDIENRDRQDISDYERAVDYLGALDAYYENHLSQMAERLDVPVDWLSRYLDVAKLPDEIVAAYPDITEIRIQHARDLKPLLKDARMRKRVIARAQEIAIEQGRAREEGIVLLDGTAVVRELKAVGRTKARKANALATYACEGTNKPMLEVSRRGRSGLILRIIPESGASKSDLVTAFERAVSEYMA